MSTNVSQSAAFCIKLNSHHSELIEAFHQLYADESLVDVTISCGGGNIKAHRVVLSASSSYFKNIFANFTTPCQYPVVIIKDITFQDLKAIIEFMYCGEITVSQASLHSLLNAARMLQVRGLSDIQIASLGNPASKFNGSTPVSTSNFEGSSVKSASKRKRIKRRTKKKSAEDDSSCSDGEHSKPGKCRRESDEHTDASCSNTEFEDECRIERKKEKNMFSNEPPPVKEAKSSTNSSQLSLVALPTQYQTNSLNIVPYKPSVFPGFSYDSGQPSRKQWGDEESKALVDSWHSEYTRCKIGGEATLSYKSVCEQLRVQGVDCTPNQVREKVRALKNNYNAIKLGTAKQLVRNHMMPFMEKLQVVLEDTSATDF